jgi:hypothetical protein
MRDEYALIGVFFRRSKRERYFEMLSNPRRRKKFVDQLGHFGDFDPAYRLPIPSKKLHAWNIRAELEFRRSPDSVYAISEDPALDQKELPHMEALEQIVGLGMGTILSCLAGQLAFVETEDERYILEHPRSSEMRG